MDFSPVLSALYQLGEAIYLKAQQVKSNRKRSRRIADRVNIILSTIRGLDDQHRLPRNQQFYQALLALKNILENIDVYVYTFKTKNLFERILAGGSHEEKFSEFNHQLGEHLSQLNLGIAVQQLLNGEEDKQDQLTDQAEVQEKLDELLRNQAVLYLELQRDRLTPDELERLIRNQLNSFERRLPVQPDFIKIEEMSRWQQNAFLVLEELKRESYETRQLVLRQLEEQTQLEERAGRESTPLEVSSLLQVQQEICAQLKVLQENFSALEEKLKNQFETAETSSAFAPARSPSPDGRAYYEMGIRENKAEKYEAAYQYFEAATRKHYVPALNYLGLFCLQGRGCEQDAPRGLRYLCEATEAGDLDALYNYARAHEKGDGIEPNLERALALYQDYAAHRPEDEEAQRKIRQLTRQTTDLAKGAKP